MGELTSTSGVGKINNNNEDWPYFTPTQKSDASVSPCEVARQPLFNDLSSLSARYPNNTFVTETGWPAYYTWWAEDKSADGKDQSVDLKMARCIRVQQNHFSLAWLTRVQRFPASH